MLVLFGPLLFVEAHGLVFKKTWTWASLKGLATTAIGIVSGAISRWADIARRLRRTIRRKRRTTSGFDSWQRPCFPSQPPSLPDFVLLLAQITNGLLASTPGQILNWVANWISGQSSSLALDLSKPTELVYHTPGLVLLLMGTF